MQAILVKYLGPTNHKGSRLKAICHAGEITISWPYELSGEEAYKLAATTLLQELGWDYELIGGQLPDGDYCFCVAGKRKAGHVGVAS